LRQGPDHCRTIVQLLLSAISGSDGEHDELLSRLCGAFKSGNAIDHCQMTTSDRTAIFVIQKSTVAHGDGLEHLRERLWIEQACYNAAVEHLRSWPARYLIDLLHHSNQVRAVRTGQRLSRLMMQMQYPEATSQEIRRERISHQINTKYIQAVLYAIEARRSSKLSYTIEDLPETAYNKVSPPLATEFGFVLYKNTFDRYSEVQQLWRSLQGLELEGATVSSLAGEAPKEKEKVTILGPLAFEALLAMQPAGGPTDEVSLGQIIEQSAALEPAQRTFSLFADLILSASRCAFSQGGQAESGMPALSSNAAVGLLAKLVSGLRSNPDYDASQASRWIRCMIQVVLDGLEISRPELAQEQACTTDAFEGPATGNDGKKLNTLARLGMHGKLSTLSKLTGHAFVLVMSNQASYPREELQWLATTLFNLGIDLYVASSPNRMQVNPACGNTVIDEVTSPEFWAKKAIEFADMLPLDIGGPRAHGEGKVGLFSHMLRERCEKLKWNV
jgi:hypothetical protein